VWVPGLPWTSWGREKSCRAWIRTPVIQPVDWSLHDLPISSLSVEQSHSLLGNEADEKQVLCTGSGYSSVLLEQIYLIAMLMVCYNN
jgi:hypothetical protein